MPNPLAPSPKTAAKRKSRPTASRRAAPQRRTADDVLDEIRDAAAKALDDGDIKTALKGLEMEAKILGLFKDSSETEADAAPAAQVQIFRIPDNERH